MQIEYIATEDDILAFNTFHYQRSPSVRWLRYLVRFVWPAVLGLIVLWPTLTTGPISRRIVAIVVLTVVVLAWGFAAKWFTAMYTRWFVRRMLRSGKNTGTIGPQRLTFDRNGIDMVTDGGTSHMNWATVERIEETADHTYIYVNAVCAIAVPKRAFATDGQRQQFAEVLKRKGVE